MPVWRSDEHEVQRWCRLLTAAGIPCDPEDLDLPTPVAPVPPWVRHATIVHPGAASPARRWPAERFAAVAANERAAGRTVVVTGAPTEVGLARRVAERAGLERRAVLAGGTDLAQLAAIVANAGRVVCGDTGVAHLATALGTPSVVLHGPVPPCEWGPPEGRGGKHRALWAGRRGDPHAGRPSEGLLSLSVDDVLDALGSLPEAVPCGTADTRGGPKTAFEPPDGG
jgi:ADP-heptose:LPS heptosyltransferase